MLLQIGSDVIDFDVVIREEYDYTAAVTEHPVERGVNLADHLRPNAVVISIEAVVSNTPTKAPSFGSGSAFAEPSLVLQFSEEFDRKEAVSERLRSAQENAEFCVWTGERGRVENLVVASFRTPYTNLSGFVVPIVLQQIRSVELQTVDVPETLFDRGKKKKNRGKVTPVPVPRESTLARLLDYGARVP